MPHSLRVRLKRLNSKGILRDTDTDRLIKALDVVDGLQNAIEEIKDDVREEMEEDAKWAGGLQYSLKIIRKHTGVGNDC